jgi:hypothetical protein
MGPGACKRAAGSRRTGEPFRTKAGGDFARREAAAYKAGNFGQWVVDSRRVIVDQSAGTTKHPIDPAAKALGPTLWVTTQTSSVMV